MDNRSNAPRRSLRVPLISLASVIIIAGGLFAYAQYEKNKPSVLPEPIPGGSFVDALGNTIPAISREAFAKLKPGCPRYLILGDAPDVIEVKIPRERTGESCQMRFTVSDTSQETVLAYQAYFQKAGWTESSTLAETALGDMVFVRPHQRVVLTITSGPDNASSMTTVVLRNFYN